MNGSDVTTGWKVAESDADLVIELPENGGPMFFRRVPAGRFRMGSRHSTSDEQPVHFVEVSEEFYLGSFPVTQHQFSAWVRSVGAVHSNHFVGDSRLPAESMSWSQARRFCDWLPHPFRFDLPTEAQWEYACRAGTETEYCSGDGEAALDSVGWFEGNSDMRTQSVGSKLPNDWGLYDMHGNVWEWCLDSYAVNEYRDRAPVALDPLGAQSSHGKKALRGGSWMRSASDCRADYRFWSEPDDLGWFQGFRLACFPA